MYRTEKLYNKIVDKELKYPVCVPSYSRPDNAFIRWVKSGKVDIPKDKLCMFIRDTDDQWEMYKPLSEYVTLVPIRPDTKDLGDTRQQIVEWAQENEHELIFMLDDRIKGVWWLNTVERNGVTYLDTDKRSTPKTAFQVWAEEHIRKGMIATSISNKGFHWMPDRVGRPIEPLNGSGLSCCIALSPMKMKEHDVNYKPIHEVGVEDVYIIYALMMKKLPFCNLSDITYDQVKPETAGGDAAVYQTTDRNARLLVIKKLFWEKTLGLEWGQKHPGFRVVQTKNESNIIRVNYPYWRKYYADTK